MKSMKKKGGSRSVVSFCEFLSFCFCTSIKMAKKAMKSMKKKGSMKKAMKSMKKKGTMKRRKAMKVSKIAKGKRAKSSVFRGRKAKTSGGLKKQDLIKSKSGKVVSKKMSDRAKLAFKKNGLAKWNAACQKARKDLKLKGFVPIGGKTSLGKALLSKIRSYWWQNVAGKGS